MDASAQKLDVIRKLLAKAERAATPDEADAYNVKAAEMMARHGIDQAMLARTQTREVIGERRIAMTDPYSKEKANLAGFIARAMGCRSVQYRGLGRGQIATVAVMGFESDLHRVELVFTSLLLQATTAVVKQRPPVWSRESATAFRRTWLAGFSAEVYRRLDTAERGAVQDHDTHAPSGTPSVALVLADRRSQVDHAYDQQFGHLRKPRARRLTGSGYYAGAEAGRRADVGQPRVANTKRALGRE